MTEERGVENSSLLSIVGKRVDRYDAIQKVTGMIRKGATSSLRFNDPGTYEYSITATPLMTVVAKGKIMVE